MVVLPGICYLLSCGSLRRGVRTSHEQRFPSRLLPPRGGAPAPSLAGVWFSLFHLPQFARVATLLVGQVFLLFPFCLSLAFFTQFLFWNYAVSSWYLFNFHLYWQYTWMITLQMGAWHLTHTASLSLFLSTCPPSWLLACQPTGNGWVG